jgi:adenylate cyclase
MTRSSWIVGAWIAVGVVASVLGLRAIGVFQSAEVALYDRYHHSASRPPATRDVTIVEITEQDIREFAHWPISDRLLAELLRRLLELDARLIGVDIYRDLPVPPGYDELARLLESEPRIFAVSKFGDPTGVGIPGPRALANSARVGFNDLLLDPDGAVRRGMLFLDDGTHEVEYAFGLRMALAMLAEEGIFARPDPDRPDWLRIGSVTLPPLEADHGGYAGVDAAGYQILLNGDDGAGGFDRVPAHAVLRGEVDRRLVAGRAVLVGVTAESGNDFFKVPFHGRREDEDRLGIPGVEIHAHILQQLLRHGRGEREPIGTWSEGAEALLVLLVALVGTSLGLAARSISVALQLLFALAGVLALGLGGLGLFRAGLWVPVAAPAATWLGAIGVATAWSSRRERRERDMLLELFQSQLSPEMADDIWRHRDEIAREGRIESRDVVATVLFVDIVGYSSRAERMDAQTLIEWVNEFMGRMTDCIVAHHGVVDDYFGDGIKANFGVPVPRESEAEVADDARRAVDCALAMADVLDDLNRRHRARGRPIVAMRVGIHTGPMVVGSVGSRYRQKYTTVGADVVTAQRLESTDQVEHDFDREPCRILVSRSTERYLDGRIRRVAAGETPLKGLDRPTAVYRVLRPT